MFHQLRLNIGRSENKFSFVVQGVSLMVYAPCWGSLWAPGRPWQKESEGYESSSQGSLKGGTEDTDDVSCNEVFMEKFEWMSFSLSWELQPYLEIDSLPCSDLACPGLLYQKGISLPASHTAIHPTPTSPLRNLETSPIRELTVAYLYALTLEIVLYN